MSVRDVEPVAEPVRGFRLIGLVVDSQFPGDVYFTGVNAGGALATQAEAVCRRGRSHRAPAWDCTCGFYACGSVDDLDAVTDTMPMNNPSALCLATVDMWGHVIEHERGMRAQFQRVTAVEVRLCSCGQRAAGFVVDDGGWLVPTCGVCELVVWEFADVAAKLDVDVVAGSTAPPVSSRSHLHVIAALVGLMLMGMLVMLAFVLGRGASPWLQLSPTATPDEFSVVSVFGVFQWVMLVTLVVLVGAASKLVWGVSERGRARTVVTLSVVAVLGVAAFAGFVTAPDTATGYTARNFLRDTGWDIVYVDAADAADVAAAVNDGKLCVFDITVVDGADVVRVVERSCQPVAP